MSFDLSRILKLSAPIALLLAAACALAQGGEDLTAKLKTLPYVTAVQLSPRGVYDITFRQPVDHSHPGGPKFDQHVFLAHSGFDKPVLLNTEGYATGGVRGGELSQILGAPNLVAVEHRYFGHSIPSPVVWKYLTVKNAADDMHAVVSSLKKLYTGKWVATGASKGGQTSLFYKCYYPNDVDATVAYVAPVNLGQEDPRIDQFIATVGDEATRDKIKAFQIALLKREDQVIPLLAVDPHDYSMGVAKAFEYGVLEIPYAYWQYGGNERDGALPDPDSPDATLAAAYKKIGAMYFYSDRGVKQFEAFQYQAFTEIGYYNYDITDLKPYLKANPNPTNLDICPAGTQAGIVFHPETMAFVFNYLQYKAQNVIFVYGETDAWSATQMQLLGRTNAVKIVVKGAWHNASIRAASPEQKEKVYSSLESWLGMPLTRL